MVTLPQQPESDFSRAVFKIIRPHIPRERWPMDTVLGRFEVAGDGLWLKADFNNFPKAYADLAAQLVREAGVDLVLKAPAAPAAAAVVRAKRWRDVGLYAFLPLMFAIPLMAALGDDAMRFALLLFCLDAVFLAFFQAILVRQRTAMAAERFIAHIPAPGLKINLGSRSDNRFSGDLDSMPEV